MARGPPPGGPARLAVPWWTHGLPPQSGPVTADTPLSAMPRSTVPAGGTTGATRCPSQGLGLQVIAARAGREHRRERGRSRGRHRFRAAASGPWPPPHGGRTVRPQPVRKAWSTGAEVAEAAVADAPSAPGLADDLGRSPRSWPERRGRDPPVRVLTSSPDAVTPPNASMTPHNQMLPAKLVHGSAGSPRTSPSPALGQHSLGSQGCPAPGIRSAPALATGLTPVPGALRCQSYRRLLASRHDRCRPRAVLRDRRASGPPDRGDTHRRPQDG